MKLIPFYLLALIVILSVFACKKNSIITSPDASVTLPSDTIRFDTVFSTVGSITQSFLIHNNNNQRLIVNSVRLGGGLASSFKINVDGSVGPTVNDIEIAANDSIYIFVSVTVNPTNNTAPFILNDSIEVAYNGVKRYVQLEAYGQNARFLRNASVTKDTTWHSDLPIVINGPLLVQEGKTLTIEKGTRVFMHANAAILVNGSMQAIGEKEDNMRIRFSSDRLDAPYNEFPGNWPGIYFRAASKSNILQYVTIRNAVKGVVTEEPSPNLQPKLVLKECIIDNISEEGIYGVHSSIQADNCLISNCGKNILLEYGGEYEFRHCTVVTYSNQYLLHKQPVLNINNSIVQNSNQLSSNLAASFTNCIFWGENGLIDDEVLVSKQGNNTFDVNFSHCLWKVKNQPAPITSNNIINNEAPEFDSINTVKRFYDFHLKPVSPAINKGMATGLTIDLDGNNRNVGLPDLGCYELQ